MSDFVESFESVKCPVCAGKRRVIVYGYYGKEYEKCKYCNGLGEVPLGKVEKYAD